MLLYALTLPKCADIKDNAQKLGNHLFPFYMSGGYRPPPVYNICIVHFHLVGHFVGQFFSICNFIKFRFLIVMKYFP